MSANLGQCGLRRRRKVRDPMQEYDTLPPVLRKWLSEAALPWSPRSCRRIWAEARRAGASDHDVLARLDRAEAATLRKDSAALRV